MNESKQRSAHISQLIDAFIAIGGNQVVIQSPPDKDFEKLLYQKVVEYASSRRFNTN